MKPKTISFEIITINGKKYFHIPKDKWQVLTTDDTNIVLEETPHLPPPGMIPNLGKVLNHDQD